MSIILIAQIFRSCVGKIAIANKNWIWWKSNAFCFEKFCHHSFLLVWIECEMLESFIHVCLSLCRTNHDKKTVDSSFLMQTALWLVCTLHLAPVGRYRPLVASIHVRYVSLLLRIKRFASQQSQPLRISLRFATPTKTPFCRNEPWATYG